MSGRSYYPTYFSIEDIMVTQEKVPCKTNVLFPRLGFLSPDNEEEDLNKDVSLNIPIWLAKKLLQKRMNLIRVEVPSPYKEKARDVFEADATVVNLFRVNPNFYEFGLSFSHLIHRENEIIRELLLKVFRKRFKMIFDWSIHRMTDPCKIQQLDLSEQRILKAGQKASELLDEWFVEAQFKMKPAEMVVSLKKRKLLELEPRYSYPWCWSDDGATWSLQLRHFLHFRGSVIVREARPLQKAQSDGKAAF